MRWTPNALTVEQVEAAGGYPLIYADPPWEYDDRGGQKGASAKYGTMADDPIFAMPIPRLAAPNAVLFLWATYPRLPSALALIEAWGFTYKTIAFQWVKIRREPAEKTFVGLGRWTRGNSEPCLLAVRGDPPRRVSASVSQVVLDHLLVAPLGRHSAKPPEVRDRIVELMGPLPRLELFARERAAGWDAWGDEVDSDVKMLVGEYASGDGA